MKRLALLLLFAGATLTSFAQNKIDFFDLADSFDWKLSEDTFKEKYNDRIVVSTDSIPDVYASTGSWLLRDIYIGKYETMTFVRYDNQTRKPAIVSMPTPELLDSISRIVSADIQQIVNHKLGKPELSLNDIDLSTFNMGNLGVEKGNIKMWMLTAPTYMTITAGNDEQQLIFIGAVPELEREPDFRQGFWGDSLADIKRKEGKADEFNMDGIYAFTTYVAGLECLSAYRFTGNKLTSGKYIFLNNNSDNCVGNYNKLVELLTKKYGEPFSNDKKTTASSYEQKIYTNGELVRNGDMSFEAYWFTPFSTIAIFLKGEQYQVSLNIEYYSNKLEEEQEKDILKDL